MMHGFNFGNSMFFGGGIFMFIFWILMIVLIASIFKGGFVGERQNKSETPMEILKIRYAKGEITKEQYQDMKEKLKD